jgi:uncharacterized protein (DUF488 family)
MAEPGTIFSIGHSTHEIDDFLNLLKAQEVGAIADVRSTPASRFNPQFNRDPLKASLAKQGIAYVFLGRELGARSEDPSCYIEGKVQYDRLARTPSFQEGVSRLEAGRAKHRIAIMCSERDPLDCHRAVLVSESLSARGIAVTHILGDGTLESHEASRMRLRKLHGMAEEDLLHSAEELTAHALLRQGERIAFVDDELRQAAAE